MDFPFSSIIRCPDHHHHLRFTILIFTILLRFASSAPIEDRNFDSTTIDHHHLDVAIRFDGRDNVQSRLRISLGTESYRFVNVSTLWPLFMHALPSFVDNHAEDVDDKDEEEEEEDVDDNDNHHRHLRNDLSNYFAVIGIHTYDRNVTICAGKSKPLISGTDLGLIWKLRDAESIEPICLYNGANDRRLSVLLLINLFDNFHPVPGGCNIEFPLEDSPYLFVHRDRTRASGPLIDYVEFQPAALGSARSPGRQCGPLSGSRLNYDIYAYYYDDYYEREEHSKSQSKSAKEEPRQQQLHEETINDYFRLIGSMSNRKWLTRSATLIHRIRAAHHVDDHHHIPDHYYPSNNNDNNQHHIVVNGDEDESSRTTTTTTTSSSSSFLRLFILTNLNQRIYFNIVAIDDEKDLERVAIANDNNQNNDTIYALNRKLETYKKKVKSKQQANFIKQTLLRSSSSLSFEQQKRRSDTKLHSLYVPSHLDTSVPIDNYVQLYVSLLALSLFSLIVAIIGYRNFILELFYFSFLISFGVYLSLCSRFHSPNIVALPGVSNWLLICSIVSSAMIATVWTEMCRRSRRLRLAFCAHSLTLAIACVAFGYDLTICGVSIGSAVRITRSAYTYYVAVGAIFALHTLFLLFLDYFWLSVLSSSFITVFFLLLPLDIYYFSGALFRILIHLWLLLSNGSSRNGAFVITFVTFTKADIILMMIFMACIGTTIYWQVVSKLASRGYAFGCLCAPVSLSKIRTTSSTSKNRNGIASDDISLTTSGLSITAARQSVSPQIVMYAEDFAPPNTHRENVEPKIVINIEKNEEKDEIENTKSKNIDKNGKNRSSSSCRHLRVDGSRHYRNRNRDAQITGTITHRMMRGFSKIRFRQKSCGKNGANSRLEESNGRQHSAKLYRCKHCNLYSTSRTRVRHRNGHRLRGNSGSGRSSSSSIVV